MARRPHGQPAAVRAMAIRRAEANAFHKRQAIARREGLHAIEDGGYENARGGPPNRAGRLAAALRGRRKPKFVFGRRVL